MVGCKAEARVDSQLQRQLPEVHGAPCLGVSALTGSGVEEVLPSVVEAFTIWNQRVTTARLNKWLVRVSESFLLNRSWAGGRDGRYLGKLSY